jgi:flavin-dependent dehydrogenase
MMMEHFDALVVGGGPAGATTALLLAEAGWSVGLLERKSFPRRKVCGEYLSATNLPLLGRLGIAGEFLARAGPPVRRVGLFFGATILDAELPQPPGLEGRWGHALGREHLDTLLLNRAAQKGVSVRQRCSVLSLERTATGFLCRAQSGEAESPVEFGATLVVAAHGSWRPGLLPTEPRRRRPHPSDLFGFKAHFHNSDLPKGLMPLLAFPGGYGGMVHSDDGRVSLSCCIRRDMLGALRLERRGAAAGDVVLEHILHHCRGVRTALAGASRQGEWLSAGPIRPGIRLNAPGGIFPVGNCAGEAHPVIAEGISMAMQSGWLLVQHLARVRIKNGCAKILPTLARAYARAWRKAFAPRLYAAAAVAHWAMRPAAVAASLPLLRRFPGLLTWGARLSGKATRAVQLNGRE